MRILTVGIGLLACSLLLVAPGAASTAKAPAASTASGNGPARFVENHAEERDDDGDEEGIGFLLFDVTKTIDGLSGTLLFAGEHHHGRYPDIVARMTTIQRAHFGAHKVTLTGSGSWHTIEATIVATAWDGDATGEEDLFSIRVRDMSGEVLFDAKGRLPGGGIVIGPVD